MFIRYRNIEDFLEDIHASPHEYVGPLRIEKTRKAEYINGLYHDDIYQISVLLNPGGLVTPDGHYPGLLVPVVYEGKLLLIQHDKAIQVVVSHGFRIAGGSLEI